MDEILEDYVKARPQRLCHMCGKCCRVVTGGKTYSELLQGVENNDDGAKDFLRIFEPYPSIAAAREIEPQVVDNIVNILKSSGLYDENALTFYKCRYLNDDNSCSTYETRPDLCKLFPSSPWAVVPPGCGFEGWLFQQRERLKQRIRKLKETILSLEVEMLTIEDPEQVKRIQDAIARTKATIQSQAPYGADDW